jgi:hypothetical protein
MKKIKIIAGITWAIICLIIMIVFFPVMDSLSASAAKLPFMKINPNYTGGVVEQQMVEKSCTLDIRKPVFDGLIGERQKGFVQLDWRGDIPDKIVDTIDYDQDNIPDFTIAINRTDSKTLLNVLNSKVLGVSVSTQTSYGWAVRISLKK